MAGTGNGTDTTITDKIRSVGDDLASTLRSVLDAVPGRPTRPNQLSRELGLNRAISSKVLSATSKQDPMEVAHIIPGPEPLRNLLQAALRKKVDPLLIAEAEAVVQRFDALIRHDAGNRSALDAIISSALPSAREKFELASKYSIYKGMSQLKGVQAETWIGTAVITPSRDDPQKHDLTWVTGALGIQRLRPDVVIRFSYRSLQDDSQSASADDSRLSCSTVPMEPFCTNEPARVEAHRAGDVINYTLPADRIGPQFATDMLVVDHHAAAMRRFAKMTPRNRNSLFVEPAFPVSLLIFDTFLHEDAFPGSDPQLVVHDTGTKGIANVNDPTRDIDRMDMQESIEFLDRDLRRVRCAEIPRYPEMLAHLCEHFGWEPGAYRGYRCRMQYPVYGWQTSMSFEPPMPPDAASSST